MKKITEFKTKNDRVVDVIEPSMDLLPEILDLANDLAAEDTFLNFWPNKTITLQEEEKWLKEQIQNIQKKKTTLIWAYFDGKIIGSVDIGRGGPRDWHVGTIGLMVAKDFRGEGLGEFLILFILEKAREMGVSIVILDYFSDNEPAENLYQKVGFKKWGCLPNGLLRQNKYSDKILMYKEIKPSSVKTMEDK